MSNSNYWAALDQLLADSEIVIDRPKNSAHPRYPEWIYPLDYGYLQNTSSMDGEGLDVWLGSDPTRRITAILCTVDLIKRDSEIKLLIGCTEEEKNIVLRFHKHRLTRAHREKQLKMSCQALHNAPPNRT